jgi:hypothetical protein
MPLESWLSLESLAWSLFRIFLVWAAFYFAGWAVSRFQPAKRYLARLPATVLGMLTYMIVALLLSSLGAMTRSALTVTVAAGALPGIALAYIRLRPSLARLLRTKHGRGTYLIIIPLLLMAFIIITNLMIAGRPNMFQDDPHVTYIVQPDRWLNSGGIFYLEETIFSAMPINNELLLLFPCALSHNRIDQLILAQLFEMSLLVAVVFYGIRILRFGWRWLPAVSIAILGCYELVVWAHLAKPDSATVFFVSLAFLVLLRQIRYRESRHGPDYSPFLLMGLALSTKQTAYVALLPFAILVFYLAFAERWSPKPILLAVCMTLALPSMHAFRTLTHIGIPVFPYMGLDRFAAEKWRMPDIELEYMRVADRSSDAYPDVGPLENVYHFLLTWESAVLLLLATSVLAVRKRFMHLYWIFILSIVTYIVVSVWLFYPAWWGAKYGILLIPFAAFLSADVLRRLESGLATYTLTAVTVFVVYGLGFSTPRENYYSLDYRFSLLRSYMNERWQHESTYVYFSDYIPSIMWMNHNLPEGTRILALRSRHRYLSNHPLFCIERHPATAGLFLENTIEEELDILRRAEITHILVNTRNPFYPEDLHLLQIIKHFNDREYFECVFNDRRYNVLGINDNT